jgi:hypothetical protein
LKSDLWWILEASVVEDNLKKEMLKMPAEKSKQLRIKTNGFDLKSVDVCFDC